MKKEFRDFESAREFARNLNLKTQKEWFEYCKSANKPDDIPQSPNKTYKKDFKGYGDWLGNEKIFYPFTEAREFIKKLNLNTQNEWKEYCKSGNKPQKIPNTPQKVYKNKGWTTWGYFLGTGTVQPQLKQFRPYREAREFVRALKLKNVKEWEQYCASGNKPDDIPSTPWITYKEWKKK